jgi:predicted ArsR family transcriptional regulator
MAVRRQMTLPGSRGLVFSQKEKQKIGRPTSFYYLTSIGHEKFPGDDADPAVDLEEALLFGRLFVQRRGALPCPL